MPVSVWVSKMQQRERPVALRAGADVGLGDRVIAAEDERDRSGAEHLADDRLDRGVRAHRIGGHDRGVAEVDHAQCLARVDAGLEMGAR